MRNYLLSQHFLKSPRLALFLIGHTNIKKRDLVLDIGAGSGVITSALAKRCNSVLAVEPDPKTTVQLRNNIKHLKNVEVVEEDFLKMTLPSTPYKIFANPPFHLSSAIFKKLLSADPKPAAIYLILQKQFALKLLNNGRHYTSELGLALAEHYDVKIRYPLKPTDFTPPPAVPTVLLELKLRLPLPPREPTHRTRSRRANRTRKP
jgi:23S rRNA (adenine-N6)-dimethyltransferase